MRLTVKVRRDNATPGQWRVTIDLDGAELAERAMLAYRDEEGWWWPAQPGPDGPDAGLAALTKPITQRTALREDTVNYGRYLFEALISTEVWQTLRPKLPADKPVELVLNWPSDESALHRHVWELMHESDTDAFLAQRESPNLVFIRTVGDKGGPPRVVTEVPRLLFAVGSRMNDTRVHAGAEFIGVMRGLDRGGGMVNAQVLSPASKRTLGERCRRFRPDLVHIVGHGSWDHNNGRAQINLQSEGVADDDPLTAPELVQALKLDDQQLPGAVLLSVCESGISYSDSAAPLAGGLVEGGVPMVIAMAGQVADSACRLFTRALSIAIEQGLPLADAVATGRRAVFVHGSGHAEDNPVDWALPTLFATPALPERFALVDVTKARMVKGLVGDLDLARGPVLCAREEFFEVLDDLLDPAKSTSVLLTYSQRTNHNDGTLPEVVGGSRLLRELAAAALRGGHVPCYVGAFNEGEAPKSGPELVLAIAARIQEIRRLFELLDGATSAALTELLRPVDGPGPDRPLRELVRRLTIDGIPDKAQAYPPDMADKLRQDLAALVADLHRRHPDVFTADAPALLLLDDVHAYDKGLDTLFKMIGTKGLGGSTKSPVVMFGKITGRDDASFGDHKVRTEATHHGKVRRVRLFRDLNDNEEEHREALAYRTLMMHPDREKEDGPRWVTVPREAVGGFVDDYVRRHMQDCQEVYQARLFRELEEFARRRPHQFSVNDDHAILTASKFNS